MIRFSFALLALVGMVAISGCGNTPKSVCESGLKAGTCAKPSEEDVKTCSEILKDAKPEELDKAAKAIKCLEESKYCEYKKDNKAAEMTKALTDCDFKIRLK